MSTQVRLIDLTAGTESWALGRDADVLLRGIAVISSDPVEQSPSPLTGQPVSPETLTEILSWLDPNARREQWRDWIAAVRAAPISDDRDGIKRRELAQQFSRGELDRFHRYDLNTPERYTGPETVDQVFDTMPPKEGGVRFGTLVKAARDAGYIGNIRAESAAHAFSHYVQDIGPVPFRDVLARAVPPVRDIVQGLIERGVPTFLSAPGGSQKSRLALQWGLSIDAGVSIFGRAVERATFVYLSAEDHADEVARRAQTIARRLQLPRWERPVLEPGRKGLAADDHAGRRRL
jgi:hypothetical protein